MMLLPVVRDIGNLSWLSRKGENEVASSRDASPSEGLGEASMTGRAGKGMNEKGQPRGRLADKGRRQGPVVMLSIADSRGSASKMG